MSKGTRLAGWIGFWVGFGRLDYELTLRGADFSRTVRETFHTETRAGKIALAITLGALGGLGFWHWTN